MGHETVVRDFGDRFVRSFLGREMAPDFRDSGRREGVTGGSGGGEGRWGVGGGWRCEGGGRGRGGAGREEGGGPGAPRTGSEAAGVLHVLRKQMVKALVVAERPPVPLLFTLPRNQSGFTDGRGPTGHHGKFHGKKRGRDQSSTKLSRTASDERWESGGRLFNDFRDVVAALWLVIFQYLFDLKHI